MHRGREHGDAHVLNEIEGVLLIARQPADARKNAVTMFEQQRDAKLALSLVRVTCRLVPKHRGGPTSVPVREQPTRTVYGRVSAPRFRNARPSHFSPRR